MLRALIIAAVWAAAVVVAVLAVKWDHIGWWVGSAALAALAHHPGGEVEGVVVGGGGDV